MNVPFLPLLLSKSARRRLLAAVLQWKSAFCMQACRGTQLSMTEDEMQQHVLEQCTKDHAPLSLVTVLHLQ